jgi:UDP-N-acetylmuramate--alanine ligase
MIDINNIKRIFFIGIGGIGMSALARYFRHKGVVVSGYDRTSTPLTKQLEAEGIDIHYYDDVALLDKSAQLVVYTPAIPAHHTMLNWYKSRQYPLVKRSEVLGMITEGNFNICVAGTHGKTSICTMVAHLLRHTGYGCNAFLGGVSANYNTNFWASDNQVCVIEADEYDRSFLKLNPDVSVVTSMDADHLDIYHTAAALEDAFVQFAAKTKAGGILIRKHSLSRLNEAMVRRMLTYQLNATEGHDCGDSDEQHGEANQPDAYAANITPIGKGYRFDAFISGKWIRDIELHAGGLHNIENMLVAIVVACMLKLEPEAIKEAVAAYKGVKRRFEWILDGDGGTAVLIDDYAHHPKELEALLNGVKSLYKGKKIAVLFQPHLFTRTRDFAAEFAKALSIADEVCLLPIYPARELPIAGVSSATIAAHMQRAKLAEKNEIEAWLMQNDADVYVTAGAGDIDAELASISNILKKKITR